MLSELQLPNNANEYQKELANPRFKTIDFGGKIYQYRVILEPNPFSGGQTRTKAQKVVFELVSPGNKQPQRQTLYTLDPVGQEKIGSNLGVPIITSTLKS